MREQEVRDMPFLDFIDKAYKRAPNKGVRAKLSTLTREYSPSGLLAPEAEDVLHENAVLTMNWFLDKKGTFYKKVSKMKNVGRGTYNYIYKCLEDLIKEDEPTQLDLFSDDDTAKKEEPVKEEPVKESKRLVLNIKGPCIVGAFTRNGRICLEVKDDTMPDVIQTFEKIM